MFRTTQGQSIELSKDYAANNFFEAARGFGKKEIIENKLLGKRVMQLFLDYVLQQVYKNEGKRLIFNVDVLNKESMTPLFEAGRANNQGAAIALIWAGAHPPQENLNNNNILNFFKLDSIVEAIQKKYEFSEIPNYQMGVKFAQGFIRTTLKRHLDFKLDNLLKNGLETWEELSIMEGKIKYLMNFTYLEGFFFELLNRRVPVSSKLNHRTSVLDVAFKKLDAPIDEDDDSQVKLLFYMQKKVVEMFINVIKWQDPNFDLNQLCSKGSLFDLADHYDNFGAMVVLKNKKVDSVFKFPEKSKKFAENDPKRKLKEEFSVSENSKKTKSEKEDEV